MRELAHVEKIVHIDPIPGADSIVVAQVLGWNVVIGKDDFKEGDLAVFFEIDSFLDASDPRYASFEPRFTNWGEKRGMRLKTIKLRKQISQGLVMKLSDFPEITNPTEGLDVTELLKVEKWESLSESESNAGGKQRGQGAGRSFPSFIPKTDQTRVQSYLPMLHRHMVDETFEESIKLDGSSMTCFLVNDYNKYFDAAYDLTQRKIKGRWNKVVNYFKKLLGMIKKPEYVFGTCSRNLFLGEGDNSHFTTYVREARILDRMFTIGKDYAIQGELIGPSIQDNHEKVSEVQFYVFDVFDIEAQQYLLPVVARDYCELIGVNYVPVLEKNRKLTDFCNEKGVPTDMKDVVDSILAYAEGPGMNPQVKREGIVFKSNKTNLSFKAISNSYLLKKG